MNLVKESCPFLIKVSNSVIFGCFWPLSVQCEFYPKKGSVTPSLLIKPHKHMQNQKNPQSCYLGRKVKQTNKGTIRGIQNNGPLPLDVQYIHQKKPSLSSKGKVNKDNLVETSRMSRMGQLSGKTTHVVTTPKPEAFTF